uniref:HUA2 n=1 Tax=Arundo donax TaxID=35708 RepID=A0A0A9GEH6_ARUDO
MDQGTAARRPRPRQDQGLPALARQGQQARGLGPNANATQVLRLLLRH